MALVDIDLKPDRKKLAQFGWISLVAFAALGGFVMWKNGLFGIDFGDHARTVAIVLFAVGGASALFSLFAPPANLALFLTLTVITAPIGFVLSYVILGALFYLMFTPVGLFFRAVGRAPLRRKVDPTAETYWTRRRTGKTDPKRYFRQY